jgi:L-iditol 2-dehydrogenase
MKAWVQTAIGQFSAQEVPPPQPAPGELILRMRAALTCGTDLKLLARGHSWISPPLTMGHEACGEIVAVGPGMERWQIGDRVVPGISGPCGRCDECASGRTNLCRTPERFWGAFSEFLRVPPRVAAVNLHRVAPGVPDEVAAFLDPLASILHGWRRLGSPIRQILVYGAGAIGLLWAAVARARGVGCVVAGRRPERLRAAEAFGALTIDLSRVAPVAFFAGSRPDVAVDATGSAEVWMGLPGIVRPGGRVLFFGGCAPGTRVSFDAARLHYSEMSLIGSFHYTPEEAHEAMELLASAHIDPRPLVTATGTLADVPEFLRAQSKGEGIRFSIRGS